MVSESVVQTVIAFVFAIGVPVLLVLFYAEGLVIGKLLQPPAVFIVYMSVTQPVWYLLVVVALGCISAASLGQWTLYRGFNEDAPSILGLRDRIATLKNLPTIVKDRVSERQLGFVEGVFEKHGAIGVCLLNVIPGIRGLSAIPAGLSDYSQTKFLLAATVGNTIYIILLAGVAFGIVEFAGLFQ